MKKKLIWAHHVLSFSFMEMGFKSKLALLVLLLGNLCLRVNGGTIQEGNIIYYDDQDLHLYFALNTETKEAMLGTGRDYDMANARAFPPDDDPWWTDGQKNLWNNVVVPETITYGGVEYTVTSVAPCAFYEGDITGTLTLPETIRSIGFNAFYRAVYLDSINIPSNVTTIGSGAFNLCRRLQTIHLPSSLTSIAANTFYDCLELKEINIPGSCTSVGEDAFVGCRSLKKVVLEDGEGTLSFNYSYEISLERDLEDKANYRCQFADSPVEEVYIGRNIVSGSWGKKVFPPFNQGKTYKKVEFGDNVDSIPANLFDKSTIENEIFLPKKLKKIGESAFSHSSGGGSTLCQDELTLPETLDSIGEMAFLNNTKLRLIYCKGQVPPSLDGLYTTPFAGCNVIFIVPKGAGRTYRSASKWEYYEFIDPSDEVITINVKKAGSLYDRLIAQDKQTNEVFKLKLKGTLNDDDWGVVKQMSHLHELDLTNLTIDSIYGRMFKYCQHITNIMLPNTIKVIGDSEFESCMHLSGTFKIPSQCTKIGASAFAETAIDGIDYTGTIEIGNGAFRKCKLLDSLNITGEETSVGDGAFWGSGVKSLTIGNGVSLGQECFDYCEKLEEIILGAAIDSIGSGAFAGCKKLKKITLEGYIKKIGKEILSSCENLSEVHVKDIASWCQIENKSEFLTGGASLFVNGEKPTEIDIPEGVDSIGAYSFYGCNLLTTVKLPKSIHRICNDAFYGCTQLEDIQLPDTLTEIGAYAFTKCSRLSSIDFPLSLSFIGEYAFNECSNLTKVVAHWDNPFNLESTAFTDVSSDCYLYVPIGTATTYSKKGWNLPNLKAAGILSISSNIGGLVSLDEGTVSNASSNFFFTPYHSFYISFTPDDGYSIRKIKLNNNDVTSQLEDGKLFIEEPEENLNLACTFSDDKIPMGDANGDGVVNVADAICAINVILKNMPNSFYDYASDMNDDGVVNITDAVLIIKKIVDNK